MLKAKDMYAMAMQRKNERVNRIFDVNSIKNIILEKIKDTADLGGFRYSFRFDTIEEFCSDLMMEKCMQIVNELEENDYKVRITDEGNGVWLKMVLTVRWDGEVHKGRSGINQCNELYSTKAIKL